MYLRMTLWIWFSLHKVSFFVLFFFLFYFVVGENLHVYGRRSIIKIGTDTADSNHEPIQIWCSGPLHWNFLVQNNEINEFQQQQRLCCFSMNNYLCATFWLLSCAIPKHGHIQYAIFHLVSGLQYFVVVDFYYYY